MKPSKIFELLIVFIILNIGCNNNPNWNRELKAPVTNSEILNGLREDIRHNLDIKQVQKKGDTLSFVIMDRRVFYPFGKLKNYDQIQKVGLKSQIKTEFYKDDIGKTELIRIYTKQSFLKFYRSDETGFYELVSGTINDNSFNSYNYLKVGMNMQDFLNIYFKKKVRELAKSINTVEFISGVDGIKQYYEFQQRRLNTMRFISDYTFPKE